MRYMLLILAAGCAAPQQYQWVHDQGANRQQFDRDHGQCEAQALASHPAASLERGMSLFGACMRGKGWRLVER